MLNDLLRSRINTLGADAGALLHLESGVCLETIGGTATLPTKSVDNIQPATLAADARATAQMALALLRLGAEDEEGGQIDEIVTMSATQYEISLPLRASAGSDGDANLLLYLRFDTSRVALAMARHRLAGIDRQVTLSDKDKERLSSLPDTTVSTLVAATTAVAPAPVSVPVSAPVRSAQPREQDEYRHMNADSILWLKNMKQFLMDWTHSAAVAQ